MNKKVDHIKTNSEWSRGVHDYSSQGRNKNAERHSGQKKHGDADDIISRCSIVKSKHAATSSGAGNATNGWAPTTQWTDDKKEKTKT